MAQTQANNRKQAPLMGVNFTVTCGTEVLPCTTFTPPDFNRPSVDMRTGVGKIYRQPGLLDFYSASLTGLYIPPYTSFLKWMMDTNTNSVEKRDLIVTLGDELQQSVLLTIQLLGCHLTGCSGLKFDASSASFLTETANFAVEHMLVEYAP